VSLFQIRFKREKYRWVSPSKFRAVPRHNGLNVASRLPRKQPYSINGTESYLMGRSARASDSSARQPRHRPPYNLLVSSSCFRGHVFITLSSSRRDLPPVLLPSITRLAILFRCYIIASEEDRSQFGNHYFSVSPIRNNRVLQSLNLFTFAKSS